MKKIFLILTVLNCSILFSHENSSSSSTSSSASISTTSISGSSSSSSSSSSSRPYDLAVFEKFLTRCTVSISYEQWKKNGQELIDAVKNNDNKKAIELLNSDQVDPNVSDIDGNTALFYANNKEMIEFLISKGAEVNIFNLFLMSPLTYQIYRIDKLFRAHEQKRYSPEKKLISIKDIYKLLPEIDSYSIIESLLTYIDYISPLEYRTANSVCGMIGKEPYLSAEFTTLKSVVGLLKKAVPGKIELEDLENVKEALKELEKNLSQYQNIDQSK